MEVTDSGIVISSALEQLRKAPLPMEATDSGMVMVVALEQPLKA